MAPLSTKAWAASICGALAIIGSAYAVNVGEELDSDLTILLHNDLYGKSLSLHNYATVIMT